MGQCMAECVVSGHAAVLAVLVSGLPDIRHRIVIPQGTADQMADQLDADPARCVARIGMVRIGMVRTDLVRIGMARTGMARIGMVPDRTLRLRRPCRTVFLFHTFWEANSRYIFSYNLLLMPYCARTGSEISLTFSMILLNLLTRVYESIAAHRQNKNRDWELAHKSHGFTGVML